MTSQTPTIQPVNEIEWALLRARSGQVPMGSLLQQLAASRAVMLMDREVGPVWDGEASPLVIATNDGKPGLAVFTAVERAAVWVDRFPKFEYALTVDFAWVLKGVQPGTSILVNPGWEEGFAIPPTAVDEMKQLVPDPAG